MICHERGVVVEGELCRLAIEDMSRLVLKIRLTQDRRGLVCVKPVVDSLAIASGTVTAL